MELLKGDDIFLLKLPQIYLLAMAYFWLPLLSLLSFFPYNTNLSPYLDFTQFYKCTNFSVSPDFAYPWA